MGFYLLTNIGESFYITSESLRDRLINNNPSISTQSSESDSLLSLDYFRRNEERSELDIFLDKLKFSDLVISPKEVQYLFERFAEFDDTNIELLSSLFVFERTHFLAIIYLFNKNLIGIDEVSDLVKADVKNRTELLLSYMSRESLTINIMEPFYRDVQKYFRRSNQYKPFSTTIFDSLIYKTIKEHNYASYSFVTNKNIFTLFRGASAFNHVQWKDPLEWWQRILVFSIIGVVTLGIVALFTSVLLLAIFLSLGITTIITTVSDLISLPYKTMYSLSFHDSFFNKSYPLMILNNFFIANNKPKEIAANSLLSFFVRDSVAQVFSQNDVEKGTAKPPMISFYAYMYWVYENSNNITKDGINLVDFNQNINNPFRVSLINDKDKIYNVDNYLPALESGAPKYPFLNKVIKDLFAAQSSFATQRTTQPISSSEVLDILVAKYNVQTRRIESNSAVVNRLRFILTDLFNSDYVINDNFVVVSLGAKDQSYFIIESIKKAMASQNITNLNVASRDALNMASIKDFVLNFRDKIISDVLAQTINTPSDAFFKIVMKDIVNDYLDYLVDPLRTSFGVLRVTEETFKIYRLLRFLMLYFSNSSLVVNLLNNNDEYKFYLGTIEVETSESISKAASAIINASGDSGTASSGSGGSSISSSTLTQL
jgi:hypothetical protein